jgi:hypothetical protein
MQKTLIIMLLTFDKFFKRISHVIKTIYFRYFTFAQRVVPSFYNCHSSLHFLLQYTFFRAALHQLGWQHIGFFLASIFSLDERIICGIEFFID